VRACVRLVTLKKRSEFLRVRGGGRWSSSSFVIETKARVVATQNAAAAAPVDGLPIAAEPRFGLTITKQLGPAVVRNRIRRRLKAAIRELPQDGARPGYDYVLIARAGAGVRLFAELKKELEDALLRVHHASGRKTRPRKS